MELGMPKKTCCKMAGKIIIVFSLQTYLAKWKIKFNFNDE